MTNWTNAECDDEMFDIIVYFYENGDEPYYKIYKNIKINNFRDALKIGEVEVDFKNVKALKCSDNDNTFRNFRSVTDKKCLTIGIQNENPDINTIEADKSIIVTLNENDDNVNKLTPSPATPSPATPSTVTPYQQHLHHQHLQQ